MMKQLKWNKEEFKWVHRQIITTNLRKQLSSGYQFLKANTQKNPKSIRPFPSPQSVGDIQQMFKLNHVNDEITNIEKRRI